MKNKIKVLLADDNREFSDVLSKYLQKQDDMEIVGIANNGVEVLAMLSELRPDVIVLDIIMPGLDGVAVLERLRTCNLGFKPKIIILSAVGHDKLIRRAIALGADYYLLKPFDMEVFIRRIREVVGDFSTDFGESIFSSNQPGLGFTAVTSYPYIFNGWNQPSIEAEVVSIIRDIGIPARMKGYQYLKEAILMVIGNRDLLEKVTKELYPMIAEKFNTTPANVDRAIRHAIAAGWNRGRTEAINEVFGCAAYHKEGRPTNREFIAEIADRVRLRIKYSSIV